MALGECGSRCRAVKGRKLHVPALLTLCFVVGACSDSTPKPPAASGPSAAAPLTSWSQGSARGAIVDFVERTTRQGTPDFVPQAERIAVFDNDGTLWAEQPMYFQLAFALDRIRALAPEHQEWKTTQPFKGALEGDANSVLAGGERSVLQIVAASHSGNTSEEFEAIVTEWIGSAERAAGGRRESRRKYDRRVRGDRPGIPLRSARTSRVKTTDEHRCLRRYISEYYIAGGC